MERRLAAILSADVVGYARLMGADEAGTLAALTDHRTELFDPKAAQHHGRTIKLMGDGVLMEFPSVVDAVQFSVDVQCAMRARNAEVPEDKRIVFRIGINIGDVIAEGDDIHGDGVNLAARIEALADPGGVCVSRPVRDQVRDKLDLDFEDMGEIKVKNIVRPVRSFRILLNDKAQALATPVVVAPREATERRPVFGARPAIMAVLTAFVVAATGIVWWQTAAPDFERAHVEDMAFALPDRPSLVVLPFQNRSANPDDDLLVDGTTESLATGLSKIPNLFLIDNRSAAHFKERPASLKDIAEELGVRYLLEGSLRRNQDQVKVSARLNDALAGRVVWAQEYDRRLADIFAIQEDIAQHIVTAMEVVLTEGGQAQPWRQETDNTEAYGLFLRGVQLFRTFSKLENSQAQRLFEKALSIDPDFHIARVHLGWTFMFQARYSWVTDTNVAWDQSRTLAEEVLRAEPDHADALTLLGFYFMYREEFDAAVPLVEKAVALDPNNAINVAAFGRLMNVVGRPQEGINLIERAMRLSPYYPAWFLRSLGNSHQLLGDYDKAAEVLEACLEREPGISEARATLAFVYLQQGRDDLATGQVAELLKRSPGYSLSVYTKSMPNRDKAIHDRVLGALRRLGIPEG